MQCVTWIFRIMYVDVVVYPSVMDANECELKTRKLLVLVERNKKLRSLVLSRRPTENAKYAEGRRKGDELRIQYSRS